MKERDRRRYVHGPRVVYVDLPGPPRFRSIMLGVAFRPSQQQLLSDRWTCLLSNLWRCCGQNRWKDPNDSGTVEGILPSSSMRPIWTVAQVVPVQGPTSPG